MRGLGHRVGLWIAIVGLCWSSTACIQRMALRTQVQAARDARRAVSTLHDYEIAREITLSGLGQLEMLHHLDPGNDDTLLLLLQSWTGAASGFIEDDWEVALDAGQTELAEYHRQRARGAYSRAIHYGLLLLNRHAEGFDAARSNADRLEAWLEDHCQDRDSAELLLWLGQAWLGRVGVSRDDPAIVADRHVGVALLERSAALAPSLEWGLASIVLAGYRAATGAPDHRGKELEALQAGSDGYLPRRLVAARIHCLNHDQQRWQASLESILDAGDPLPEARLQNAIAMRRARRYLSGDRWRAACEFEHVP